MKRKLFSLVALCGAIVALAAGPKADFNRSGHDFGNIREVDGPVTCDFVITNTGDAPLIVISATASCGCTTPVIPKEPIMPGASKRLTVTYDPIGRPGEFTKNIKVKTNDSKTKSSTLKITGCVIPK